MASLPLHPCRTVGCRQLIAYGQQCPEHGRVVGEYELYRAPSNERGYDRRWRNLRAMYLSRHPWCELQMTCAERPITQRLAVEVHHRRPIREAPELRLVWGNLAATCGPCHDAAERANRGGQATIGSVG